MKCKIIFERDPKTLKVTDKIKAVKAPNGKRSLLFDSIKDDIKDDNEALVNYYKVYTNEFKELFGDWENIISLRNDDSDDNFFNEMYFEINLLKNKKQLKVNEIENLKIKIKSVYFANLFDDNEVNSLIDLLSANNEDSANLAMEIIINKYGSVLDKLDKNGEPKYSEVKDIISPTGVDFDNDLNTKLKETDKDNDVSLKSKLPDDTGDIDNTVKEKYFNDGDTQSHTTILQRIVDDKHPLAPLAEKLLSLSSEDMTVELVDKPYIETDEYKSGLKGEKSSKSAATYQEFGEGDTKRRVINIASRAPINTKDLVPVILHEMLHGYTISELNKNTKVARQLSKIHKEALKYRDEFRDDYPLTSLNEFIVAVYTNPYFIQDLQKLPSLGPNKSLWEDLLKYFKALFEFNLNERTLFDDAFYVSNKVLENYSDSVKERSTIKHKDPSNEFFEKIYNVEITEETVGSEVKEDMDDGDVAKSLSKATENIMKSIAKRIDKPLAEVYDNNRIEQVTYKITEDSVIGAIASLTGVNIDPDSIQILPQSEDKTYNIPNKYIKNLDLKKDDFFLSKVIDGEKELQVGKRLKNKEGIKLSKRDSIITQIQTKYDNLIISLSFKNFSNPYLISDLSKGYLEFAANVAENNGEFDNAERLRSASKDQINEMISEVRKTQIADIQTWINYLNSRPDYSTEFKYYVLNSVIKSNVVNVDVDKGKVQLTKRNKSSVNSFESLNARALANVYDKPNTPNKFLYDYAIDMATTIATSIPKEKEFERTPKGTWYKFVKGDENILSSFVSDTPWCTGSVSTARNQLNGGDFYVFNPINSEVNEKIAIRMNDNNIGEIRGMLAGQDLKESSSPILDSFIKENLPGQERSLKKLKYLKLRSEFKADPTLFNNTVKLRELIIYSRYNDSYGGDDMRFTYKEAINKGVELIKQEIKQEVSNKLGKDVNDAKIVMLERDHYSQPLDNKLKFTINYPDGKSIVVDAHAMFLNVSYSDLHYYNSLSDPMELDIVNRPTQKKNGLTAIQRINVKSKELVNIKSVYDDAYDKKIIIHKSGSLNSPGNRLELGYKNNHKAANEAARKNIINQLNDRLSKGPQKGVTFDNIFSNIYIKNIIIDKNTIKSMDVSFDGIKDVDPRLHSITNLITDDSELQETNIKLSDTIKNIKIANNVFNKNIKKVSFGGRFIEKYGFDIFNSNEFEELINLVDSAEIRIWEMESIPKVISIPKNTSLVFDESRFYHDEQIIPFIKEGTVIVETTGSDGDFLNEYQFKDFKPLTPIIGYEKDWFSLYNPFMLKGLEVPKTRYGEDYDDGFDDGSDFSKKEFIGDKLYKINNQIDIEYYESLYQNLESKILGAFTRISKDKSLILLHKDSNITTPLHELTHLWETVLTREEKKAILDWTGDKEWTTNTSERFAKGFEQYVYEGIKTGNKEIDELFAKFSKWFKSVIKYFNTYFKGSELNPEIKNIYNKMLTEGSDLNERTSKLQERQLLSLYSYLNDTSSIGTDTTKDVAKSTTKEGPTTIIKTKKLPTPPTKKSTKKTTISDSTIEDKFNLRNTDGSRKRYTDYNKALDKTRKLNKANRDRPFKFTIIKILGEKGDSSRTYYAIKVVPRGGDTKYSLSGEYAGQPKTDTESSAGQSTTKSGVGIPVDVFKNAKDKNGKDLYSEDQIKVIETYNNKTSLLTGEMVEVNVEELPFILRETFKKKGLKTTMLYGANNKKGYIIGRVSHAQDIIKTKKQTEEKATEQEHSAASTLARNMGTDMHSLNEAILKYITESNNPGFEFKDNLRSLDVNLWKEDAMKAFKETDEYKSLLKKGNDIFLNKSNTYQGVTTKIHDSDRMIDKLVESMLSLYHQVSVTQDEINRSINEGKEVDERVKHKPLFMLEKPVLDPAGSTDASGNKSVAGTMDIFVVFSDGSASIYDHKFTNLRPEKREFKKPTAKQRDKIYEIRRAQGLSTKRWKYNDFYYVLPDDAVSFMKQESWNAQIGRYSQMVTSLYGVKKIRQARILPVATTYTREKTGEKRKNKKGEEFDVTALDPETSKVEFILTGQEDEGIAQWALDIEKTGDLKLDEFIKKLIDTKKALHKERVEKKAWNDPKYIDRIKKLDESIQALLIDRKLTKIADSINSLAVQIENDLQSDDITFEQIITHLRDIKTFESFTKLTGVTLKNLEEKYKDEIEAGEDNEYTTFSNNLMRARYKLNKNEGLLQNKLTSMVYDVNRKGGYMSEKLFASLETQLDMGSRGGALASWFTHLRNSNHPLISLFSQVLDKVDTNVIKERRELESKVNKATKELAKWGESKGLSGVKIYKDILTENDKLIFKYTNYKKEVFPDYSDPKSKSNNIKWFKENFERVGVKDDIFQERLKRFKEYFDSTSVDKDGKVDKKLAKEKLDEWKNKNDIKYNKGNNDAWTNVYVQGLLTPKNPEEYYTEEYKNLLRGENKPLLNFYNMYTEQMNTLAVLADFQIGENWLPEIRKDMIDTMVQDGYIMGLKQQYENVKNAIKVVDADDGFQQVQTDGYLGSRKVPIFFTHSVGKGNKSLDLSKSLMIFSDFVHKYKGHKDNEYAILAMRELLANTTGVKQTKGKLGLFKTAARDEANNILKSKDNNAEMLKAFDKWIKFYIYGEKKQDSSAAANKVVDTMVGISSYKSIALNMLSASAGHVNAEAQLNYLAKKANYFSRESLGKSRKDQKRFKALLESFRKSTNDTEKVESKMLFAAMFFEMAQESLTYEKANSVSASTMRSTMKKDFAYFMQRWSDDVIDNTTLGAMMRDYAIDPTTGHTQPIYKLKEFYKNNPKYKNTEWKSLWDSIIMHKKDLPDSLTSEQRDKLDMFKGPVIINQHTGEIMGDRTFTDFRRKAKEVVSRAKGNMSNADTALYKTYAVGRLLMQYRGWIPSTVLERVKSEQYNLTMEQFEVGRWVAAQKMLLRRVDSKWKQFLIQVIPFVEGDFSENTSTDILDEMTPMQIKYRQFIADNPHLEPDKDNPSIDQISYEEYYNTYVGELKTLAKEIQIYFAIAGVGMLFLMAGGDDEYKENPLMRGLMELIDRVLLELGFFLPAPYVGLGETMQLVTRKPAASVDVITSGGKLITNTFTELFDFISGVESDEKRVLDLTGPFELELVTKKDKTSVGYYAHQWLPPLKLGDKLFGFYDDSDARETWWDYVTGEDFVK